MLASFLGIGSVKYIIRRSREDGLQGTWKKYQEVSKDCGPNPRAAGGGVRLQHQLYRTDRKRQKQPSVEALVNIANALGVTVDQLLKKNYKYPERLYLQDIANRIEKYTVTQKIQVCEDINDYLDSLEKFRDSK